MADSLSVEIYVICAEPNYMGKALELAREHGTCAIIDADGAVSGYVSYPRPSQEERRLDALEAVAKAAEAWVKAEAECRKQHANRDRCVNRDNHYLSTRNALAALAKSGK